ncbi:MAG: cell surface protein [Deltaproteobacteria bacterium]|nr:cell surface protein [Deltaproteobacteria bacterium]
MLRSKGGRIEGGTEGDRRRRRGARAALAAGLLAAATACLVEGDDGAPCDPHAVRVVSFAPGPGAGFGAAELPGIVLGPPSGGGAERGSTDVVSLGVGGEIVLELGGAGILDGPGADLLVFENAFYAGGDPTRPFVEPGVVGVSADGTTFVEFPCGGAAPWEGCAGRAPVFAAPGNGIDPADPAAAGGDAFDLADLGLSSARFVRVRDRGLGPAFPDTAGFDLDAVVAVHACGE